VDFTAEVPSSMPEFGLLGLIEIIIISSVVLVVSDRLLGL
jgi:hypothetical protein